MHRTSTFWNHPFRLASFAFSIKASIFTAEHPVHPAEQDAHDEHLPFFLFLLSFRITQNE